MAAGWTFPAVRPAHLLVEPHPENLAREREVLHGGPDRPDTDLRNAEVGLQVGGIQTAIPAPKLAQYRALPLLIVVDRGSCQTQTKTNSASSYG